MTELKAEVPLKPCPFCNAPAIWRPIVEGLCDVPFGVIVEHSEECFMRGRLRDFDALPDCWNARPADDVVEELVKAWAPMAFAVMEQMSDELAYPAASISADVQADGGIEITEKQALDIMRAFRTLGIADFGPLYDQDSDRVMGRGYWLSGKGYKLRAALANAWEAVS